MKATEMQIAGNHYKKLAIQPFQFTAANDWDAFAHTILKYVTRWRDKAGVIDLEKALHTAHLRIELDAERAPTVGWHNKSIFMSDYIKANNIPEGDDAVLYALELWVMSGRHSTSHRALFISTMETFIETVKTDPEFFGSSVN